MGINDDNENHPFYNDRAIGGHKEDSLKRSKFSNKLAKAISSWKQKDSLVIGVYGKWGDGKSSVKNMLIESLKEEYPFIGENVIDFNPWEWQEQNAISQELFDEIQCQLIESNKTSKRRNKFKKVIKLLKQYAPHLHLASRITNRLGEFSKWMSGILIAALGGAGGLSLAHGHYIIGVIALLSIPLSIAKFLKSIEDFFSDISHFLDSQKKSLKAIKKEVAEALSQLDNPIVIIIDDIDRLNKKGIEALFQTIKANADFPNLVYVLFFQRDIVENILTEGGVRCGAEYLKKIVQIPFELPKPSIGSIHNFLQKGILKIAKNEGLIEKITDHDWEEIFSSGAFEYFTNLREVKRFLSTLEFQIGMLKNNNVIEVNIVDLIILEIIRQYEPELYEAIYKNKNLFTSNLPRDYEKSHNDKIIKTLVEKSNNSECVKGMVFQLFPRVECYFTNIQININDADSVKLRLCHPDFFDRYFQFHLSDGDISQEEIENAISNSADIGLLKLQLNALYQNNLLGVFLYRFVPFSSMIVNENSASFITALFDIGDLLALRDLPAIHGTTIVGNILASEKDKDKKLAYIASAIQNTKGIYLPLYWIDLELQRIKNPGGNRNSNFEGKDIEILKDYGLSIIRKNCDNDEFCSLPQLSFILLTWEELGDIDGAKNWVKRLIATNAGALKLICAFSFPMSDKLGIRKYIDPENIEKFTNFNKLFAGLQNIDNSTLNSEEKAAIDAMRNAHAKRRVDFEQKSTSVITL